MSDVHRSESIRALTVGWEPSVIADLFDRVSAASDHQLMHLVHPRFALANWPSKFVEGSVRFFRENLQDELPEPDDDLLASLEDEGLPSIHTMILGDRVLSKLSYVDAKRYATFVASRLIDVYREDSPDVVFIGFDSVHASLALAVGRKLNVPTYALNFSVLPPGYVCLCDQMNPGSRVRIRRQSTENTRSLAEATLRSFKQKEIAARAHIPPPSLGLLRATAMLPGRLASALRTRRRARNKASLKYTEGKGKYSIVAAVSHLIRTRRLRKATLGLPALQAPPNSPYVLFGLHMQPESSIDVWAPFFSNQMWVVELLSRSVPPTHKLLVKIHKSDVTRFSRADYERMRALPGVEFVAPFADARPFIEQTSLLLAIQGTMGLEAALLGKPVIMLGKSPVEVFPSASTIGALPDLPSLVRQKLAEKAPREEEIVDAFAHYLEPFFAASDNRWSVSRTPDEVLGYVAMLDALYAYLQHPKSGDASS